MSSDVQDGGGLTMGKYMFVDPDKNTYENRFHEYKHTLQIQELGWAFFYARTVFEYIKYGFEESYKTPGTLEYEAEKYMREHTGKSSQQFLPLISK